MRNAPAPTDDTLTLQEAASLAHCGVELMRELVDNGTVPAVRLNPKHCAIVRDQFLQWLRDEAARQAETRRAQQRRIAAAAATGAPRRRGRGRAGLPELERYEVTTGAPPASTPAGSRTS